MACVVPGTAGREWLKKGLLCSALLEAAVPPDPTCRCRSGGRRWQDDRQQRMVVGVDPHKRSVTIEMMGPRRRCWAMARTGTDVAGTRRVATLREPVRAPGLGDRGLCRNRPSRRCPAARGRRTVVDVPLGCRPKVRVSATGQGRKTDATDVTPSPWSESAWPGYGRSSPTPTSPCSGCLADRRRQIGESTSGRSPSCTPCCSSCSPVGEEEDLSAAQASNCSPQCGHAMWSARPDAALPPSSVADLERLHVRKKAADKELREIVAATDRAARPAPASVPLVPPGCWSKSATSPGSPIATTSRPRPAPPPSTPPAATTSDTGSHEAEPTVQQRPCPPWPPSSSATRHQVVAPTTAREQRQPFDGSDALPQTPTLRHRLPHHARDIAVAKPRPGHRR